MTRRLLGLPRRVSGMKIPTAPVARSHWRIRDSPRPARRNARAGSRLELKLQTPLDQTSLAELEQAGPHADAIRPIRIRRGSATDRACGSWAIGRKSEQTA